ncbi:HEAT repeat domain-containing protein [Gellertiella hungarica]|uniref:HEAT repeat protein n=1 Tax=Gellertiella hungarica TaxID=1572859 RepID=A0A7W6J772_9HYPH|nr:HEAT repeat domain-containing protein [Gellertiella hungarica]MBB4066075.1 HEAT repeat protein [Gellertiella hungarica]
MPLRKTRAEDLPQAGSQAALSADEAIALLGGPDAAGRQAAARRLAGNAAAAEALCARFAVETDIPTREAIAVALMRTQSAVTVERLLPFLSSEDAALRNTVIEILQALPAEVAPHMERLLDHPDSDVRIFAVNVLEALRHPKVEEWLIAVVSADRHPNVVATALDLLGEVGTEAAIPALSRIAARFADEPFLKFAAGNAMKRIGAGS